MREKGWGQRAAASGPRVLDDRPKSSLTLASEGPAEGEDSEVDLYADMEKGEKAFLPKNFADEVSSALQ